jgi:hypothetical protein
VVIPGVTDAAGGAGGPGGAGGGFPFVFTEMDVRPDTGAMTKQ